MAIIVSDTTAGLPLDLTAHLGIPVIPQIVNFGDQSFRDDTELTTADFLSKLKSSSTLPTTAAPPPALYFPVFELAASKGESVIVIAPSAKISGTVRAAEVARQDFSNVDIHIIDTQTVAGCLGSLVQIACEMNRMGSTVSQIIAKLNQMIPFCHTYFLLDTLEYLQKGGRIGKAQALLGELLNVKPILQIKEGQAAPLAQERTKIHATARLIELTCEHLHDPSESYLCVMHINTEVEALSLKSKLSSQLGITDIPIYLLPPAVVTHVGPKALAVGFFSSENQRESKVEI
jgi:DegV family protein with EDD domain